MEPALLADTPTILCNERIRVNFADLLALPFVYTCPDSVQMIIVPSVPKATSLAALNCFLKVQMRCTLTREELLLFLGASLSSDNAGDKLKFNEKTSPLEERAAKELSQQITLAMLALFCAIGGRYVWISNGKYCVGKLDEN